MKVASWKWQVESLKSKLKDEHWKLKVGSLEAASEKFNVQSWKWEVKVWSLKFNVESSKLKFKV